MVARRAEVRLLLLVEVELEVEAEVGVQVPARVVASRRWAAILVCAGPRCPRRIDPVQMEEMRMEVQVSARLETRV